MPDERIPRRHELFFSPRDYLNDPAVLAMTTLARGIYSTLLFSAWDLDRPGVVPDNDNALASLARCTGQEWAESKAMVQAAFDTTSDPGWWVQRRMVREHKRQDRYFRVRKATGRQGGIAKERNRKARLPSLDLASTSSRPLPIPQLPPVSSVASGESRTQHPCPSGDGLALDQQPLKTPKEEWLEAFDDFYPDYPRKVKPDDARKAWLSIKPWTQEVCDAIFAGLERWRRYWTDHETPKDKIPYPGSFLRSGQWKGEAA